MKLKHSLLIIFGTPLLILGSLVALASCTEQEVESTSPSQVQDVVGKMRFARHPQARDLCIGYVYVTNGGGKSGTGGPGLIEVDCAKVEHLLDGAAPERTTPERP